MKEATRVLHSVQNFCVNKSNVHVFDQLHPKHDELEESELENILQGYTYMKWAFGDKRTLITRGQVHSYLTKGGNE